MALGLIKHHEMKVCELAKLQLRSSYSALYRVLSYATNALPLTPTEWKAGCASEPLWTLLKNSVSWVGERTIPTERPPDHRLSAKLLSTFKDIGCHVVSATNPHGRNLGLLVEREKFLSHASSPVWEPIFPGRNLFAALTDLTLLWLSPVDCSVI
jgi:hypothetical protein